MLFMNITNVVHKCYENLIVVVHILWKSYMKNVVHKYYENLTGRMLFMNN